MLKLHKMTNMQTKSTIKITKITDKSTAVLHKTISDNKAKFIRQRHFEVCDTSFKSKLIIKIKYYISCGALECMSSILTDQSQMTNSSSK